MAARFDNSTEREADLELQLDAMTKERDALRAQLEELTERLAAAEAHATDLALKLDATTRDRDELLARLNEMTSRCEASSAHATELALKLDAVTCDRDELREHASNHPRPDTLHPQDGSPSEVHGR